MLNASSEGALRSFFLGRPMKKEIFDEHAADRSAHQICHVGLSFVGYFGGDKKVNRAFPSALPLTMRH